jgi:hypothetical protein
MNAKPSASGGVEVSSHNPFINAAYDGCKPDQPGNASVEALINADLSSGRGVFTQWSETAGPRTEAETERLLHELQDHKTELEMQNAELRRARDEVELLLAQSKEAEKAQKDTQQQLKEVNESLEQRVNAEIEMRRMEKLLLSQNRQAAMGEMIGCIAHQWRQPLNVLGMSIQRLPLYYEMGRFDKEFLDKSVHDAMQIIKHMSQTIDDFKNFFATDKVKVLFEIAQAVNATATLVQGSLKSKNIALEIIMRDPLSISGYPNEYAQALLNIVLNAQDALQERKVEKPRITMSSFTENDKAVVIISDNAGGVPEELMDRIFEPFFTTKGPDKGTGIGLFMAKTIIEKNMGGRLTVRNFNGGAEFRIEV